MKGITLSLITDELYPVSPEHNEKPAATIADGDERSGYYLNRYDILSKNHTFSKDYHSLPLRALQNFSFDELCKMKYSTIFSLDESVQKVFETEPSYELFRKITSSMWRWGYKYAPWNEVVETYNCFRSFSLGINDADFDFRLDYTTGNNEWGYTKFGRTFIDGVFGILLYYKGEHVMTIGFSITHDKRILIQQVQLKSRKGNRWLYRFPENRVEFALDMFSKNFPGYELFLIDGASLVKKTLGVYQFMLDRYQEQANSYQNSLDRELVTGENRTHCERMLALYNEDIELGSANIAHAKNSAERITNFYAQSGKFVRGTELTLNGLLHYKVTKHSVPKKKKAVLIQLASKVLT